jgi:hypothetical protein
MPGARAQLASPESINKSGSMDSGLAASLRPGMTNVGGSHPIKFITPRTTT